MLLSSLLSSRLRDVWPLWRLKIQDRRLQTERRRVTKRIGISSRSFQEALAEMPIVHSSFSSACCLTAGPTTRLRPHGLGQGTAAWGKRQHLTSASYCFLWGSTVFLRDLPPLGWLRKRLLVRLVQGRPASQNLLRMARALRLICP